MSTQEQEAKVDPAASVRQPPTHWLSRFAYLGPGIIIAGSIVGAGELIATTSTGAVAGFSLLWLIILGCIIKVFVQVELGKHAVLTGDGTMQALGDMPGPRIAKVNWALLAWFVMYIAGIFSLGGVLSGIGQAMALVAPVTTQGRIENGVRDHQTRLLLLVEETLGQQLQQIEDDGQADLLRNEEQTAAWGQSLAELYPLENTKFNQLVIDELVWIQALQKEQQDRSKIWDERPGDLTPSQEKLKAQMDSLGSALDARETELHSPLADASTVGDHQPQQHLEQALAAVSNYPFQAADGPTERPDGWRSCDWTPGPAWPSTRSRQSCFIFSERRSCTP